MPEDDVKIWHTLIHIHRNDEGGSTSSLGRCCCCSKSTCSYYCLGCTILWRRLIGGARATSDFVYFCGPTNVDLDKTYPNVKGDWSCFDHYHRTHVIMPKHMLSDMATMSRKSPAWSGHNKASKKARTLYTKFIHEQCATEDIVNVDDECYDP